MLTNHLLTFVNDSIFITRRYFIDELILNSFKVLRPPSEGGKGLLVFIQSSMADLDVTLFRLNQNGYDASVVATCQFPWRQYYFDVFLFTMSQ